jgi:hypothetical protein
MMPTLTGKTQRVYRPPPPVHSVSDTATAIHTGRGVRSIEACPVYLRVRPRLSAFSSAAFGDEAAATGSTAPSILISFTRISSYSPEKNSSVSGARSGVLRLDSMNLTFDMRAYTPPSL